ncbi:MAG: RdgB/HAM1 family non-canonical purine NTP pyrophosphatase [Deferribacteraceae bacterium]|jgi:XTP/dITP diphosphohydrolase|nr:RdgB/HAM1 family non-canonical purine NTP pyrophosphatase [Deferribacteraceae bacterium]
MTIYVATANAHKIEEIKGILTAEILIHPQYNTLEIVESGDTFEENALIKAIALSKLTDEYVIADDSGLSVDALDAMPGVHSSRYSGGGDSANNALLLHNMQNITDRTAKFVCVIALAKKGEVIATFRGECHGDIANSPTGSNGFGYDPLFIPKGYDISMAQLMPAEKNAISHRRHALEKLADYLK